MAEIAVASPDDVRQIQRRRSLDEAGLRLSLQAAEMGTVWSARDEGEVIGIATAGAEQQGFNFLVPINTAMEFVRQTGVTPARGAFDQHWDAGLDLYDAGQYRQIRTAAPPA